MKSILIKASLKFRVKEIGKRELPPFVLIHFERKERRSEWKEKHLDPTTLITGSRATRSWNAIRNVVAKYFRDLNVIVQSTSGRRFCVETNTENMTAWRSTKRTRSAGGADGKNRERKSGEIPLISIYESVRVQKEFDKQAEGSRGI